MRILLVTETLTAGGAETFVIRLANALASDHSVMIAVLHGELIHPALIDQVAAAVAVERLEHRGKRWLWRAYRLLRWIRGDRSIMRSAQHRWLAGIARWWRPDVIHSHLLKADRAAAELSDDHPRLRHVITPYGDNAPYLKGQANPHMPAPVSRIKSIVERSDAIVAICIEQSDFVAARFPEAVGKTRLIHNGYAPCRNERPTASKDDRAITFGMVS